MKVILVGGNEFQKDDGIDAWIAGRAKKVGFVTFAEEDPTEQRARFRPLYGRLGAEPVWLTDASAELPADIEAVYLTGGHPDLLKDKLQDTKLWQSITAKFQAGELLLAGSSAGAMVLFEDMLAHGSRMSGDTELTPGLGLLGEEILVPHWDIADKTWKKRLLATHAERKIIAIDEQTALIRDNGQETTVGLGSVHQFLND